MILDPSAFPTYELWHGGRRKAAFTVASTAVAAWVLYAVELPFKLIALPYLALSRLRFRVTRHGLRTYLETVTEMDEDEAYIRRETARWN